MTFSRLRRFPKLPHIQEVVLWGSRSRMRAAWHGKEESGAIERLHIFEERADIVNRLLPRIQVVMWCICDAYGVHKRAARWLFKQFLTGPAEIKLKAQVKILNSANIFHGGALKSYSATFPFLLKPYVTDENMSRLDAKVCNLRQESMTPAEHRQEPCTKTLVCGSVYDESLIKALIPEGVTHPIRKNLRQWWTEDQHASLEHFLQRA